MPRGRFPAEKTSYCAGTVVVGSQAARDVEVVVTGPDDGKIAGRTNAAGSFEVAFPVEDDVDNGRMALEIAAPELETSVEDRH